MKAKLDNGQILEVFEDEGLTYARIGRDGVCYIVTERNDIPILIRTLPDNRVILQFQRENKMYEREILLVGTVITSFKAKEIHGN